MKEAAFEKINRTPIRTWSWLNINDITIKDYTMPYIGKYSNQVVEEKDEENIIIQRIDKSVKYINFHGDLQYKGVSEELYRQTEKDYNSKILIHAKSSDLCAKDFAKVDLRVQSHQLHLQ